MDSQLPPSIPYPLSLGVVILGAGASSRMGQPKLLLPWDGSTILGHLISQWKLMGADQIAVVLALSNSPISPELDRLAFPSENRIFNLDSNRGMFSSIQSAAGWPGWKSKLTHWAIVLGDQPHLMPESLARLVAFAATATDKICQPSREAKPRHPVILPRLAFRALAAAKTETLKEFLRESACGTALIEIDDPGLDLDIDKPEDYQKAILLNQSRSVNTPFQSTL